MDCLKEKTPKLRVVPNNTEKLILTTDKIALEGVSLSFRTGKAAGLTASLIAVIVPVIAVVLYGVILISLLGSITSGLTGGSSSFGSLPSISYILISLIIFGIVSFVGVILFLIAMHNLSEYYKAPGIFRNALWSFLTNIMGGVVLVVILIALTFSMISALKSATSLSGLGVKFLVDVVVILVAAFVVSIVSALLYMRAFNKLGDKSGVHSFRTAGTLYLIGTALTIVLVGPLIVWISWIFAVSGFSSLKPQTGETTTISYPLPQPPATISPEQKKFCAYCGAEISLDSVYCPNCGKQV